MNLVLALSALLLIPVFSYAGPQKPKAPTLYDHRVQKCFKEGMILTAQKNMSFVGDENGISITFEPQGYTFNAKESSDSPTYDLTVCRMTLPLTRYSFKKGQQIYTYGPWFNSLTSGYDFPFYLHIGNNVTGANINCTEPVLHPAQPSGWDILWGASRNPDSMVRPLTDRDIQKALGNKFKIEPVPAGLHRNPPNPLGF